ncbi:YqhV family protein [Fictibacillus iocasae]|uniref:YqhV family protein n=1 Tax=Fictibacillus iocasae TaxID=2715437 RepID=A0ABW2NRB2_9BACL
MLQTIEKIVLGMAAIRIFSGLFEITAALFMLHYNTVERALLVNSLLSMVGPIIFFSTMTLGLYGISTKMNASNLVWIMAGIILIVYGIKK